MLHYPEQSHAIPQAVPVLRSLASSSALVSNPHLPLDLVSISYLRSLAPLPRLPCSPINASPLSPPCIHAVFTDRCALFLGFNCPKTRDDLLFRLISKLVD